MDANRPTRIAGRNIRRIRQRAGLSQAALAGAAGIGQTYIGQLERAKKLALLALVDCCNQERDTQGCWPSLTWLTRPAT